MLRIAMVLTAVAAATYPARLAVTASGVGPIRAGVVVNAKTLAKLFSSYRATEHADESEGEVVGHAVTLSENGKPVLVVHGDAARKLVSVEAVSPEIQAPHGLHVGASFGQLQKLGKLDCLRGSEERAGELLCALPPEKSIVYVGEVAELGARWNGPDDQVPPAALAADLTIRRIAWLAP